MSDDQGPGATGKPGAKKDTSMMGAGIGVGLALGAAVGLLLDNVAVGIAIGLALGLAVGASLDKKKSEGPKSSE